MRSTGKTSAGFGFATSFPKQELRQRLPLAGDGSVKQAEYSGG